MRRLLPAVALCAMASVLWAFHTSDSTDDALATSYLTPSSDLLAMDTD